MNVQLSSYDFFGHILHNCTQLSRSLKSHTQSLYTKCTLKDLINCKFSFLFKSFECLSTVFPYAQLGMSKCRSIRNTKLTTLCYVNKARVLLLFSWFNMLIKFCFKQSFSIASFVMGSQKRFWWLSHSVNLWTWYFLLSAQNVNKNLPRNVLHNKDCDPCISI